MKIRFTDTALDEVDEILSYIAQHNPSAAVKVADAIRQAVVRAAERPQSSPVVFAEDVRAKLVGRFQYRVYYVVRDDELIIRNVRSTRRQRPWEESGA
jgi:addiction module RelE/StbE family toxin